MDFHSLDALYERFCEFFEDRPTDNPIEAFARSVLEGKVQTAQYPARPRDQSSVMITKYDVWTLMGWAVSDTLQDAEGLLATHLGTTYEIIHAARVELGIQPLGENGA